MNSKMYLLVILFLVSFSYSTNTQTIQSCCSHVSQWDQCYTACMQFASPSCAPNVENKTHYLLDYCPQIPPILNACFDNITSNSATQPTPDPQLVNCCMKSSDANCRQVCIEQVTIGTLGEESIQVVIGACGPPFVSGYDPIWNCFLLYADQGNENQQPANNGGETNMNCTNITTTLSPPPSTPSPLSPTINYADWPRLHCCSKANDSVCSQACLYEFTGSRTSSSWETLYGDCKYRATEGELASCLDDVNNRCSPSCTQLNFCSGFNNRPFTSFRNCTAAADTNAKSDYNLWMTSNIIYHPFFTLITKPLSTCYPEMWKLVACSFHVMPCQSNRDTSLICKEDCLFLMNACKHDVTLNVEDICEALTPSYLQMDCISLEEYLNVSSYTKEVIDNVLTTPCSSNPCTNGKCIINEKCQESSRGSCQPYHCIDESKIGNAPEMIVKKLNTIHVSTSPFNEQQSCYGYINCTMDSNGNCVFGGKASNVSKQYCVEETSCMYKGTNYSHNEIFNDDCNICHCKSNRVICTHHICHHGNTANALSSCSPPQCNCPPYYQPVCTNHGLIVPNIHFANCHEHSISQSCSYHINDLCESKQCSTINGVESKCVPYPRVCLATSPNEQTCPQYQCVSSNNCGKYQNKVICDKNERQHDSMCNFINNEEQVDYYGYCKVECSLTNRRPVCGVNGQTYPSSCHAKGAGIAIDYIGQCSAVPNTTGQCEWQDERYKCPGLPYINSNEQCQGPTPPGSCCPQCGAMLNILIDHQQLTHNREAMGVSSVDSTDVIDRLSSFIDILECELYGHQTIDGSFIVLLLPSNMTSTINVESCHAEAIRLTNLINRGSPLLMSDPYLSFLIAANHTLSWKQFHPPIVSMTPGSESVSGCGTLKVSSYFLYALILIITLISIGWAELLR